MMSTLYYNHKAQVPDAFKNFTVVNDDGSLSVEIVPKTMLDQVVIRDRLKEIFADKSYELQPSAMNAVTADVVQAYTVSESGTVISRAADGSSLEDFMKHELREKSPIFYKARHVGGGDGGPSKKQRDAMSTNELWELASKEGNSSHE